MALRHVAVTSMLHTSEMLSYPGFQVPEELLEGSHVTRLEHFSKGALGQAAPVLGDGRIQNPCQLMAWILRQQDI